MEIVSLGSKLFEIEEPHLSAEAKAAGSGQPALLRLGQVDQEGSQATDPDDDADDDGSADEVRSHVTLHYDPNRDAA